MTDMRNKTVVVTGATSGIGRVAALELAGMGARIAFVARNRTRADALLTQLRAINPNTDHFAAIADLSLIGETKRAAAEIAAAAPVVDVLVNNAGAMFGARTETAEGLEKTFALNHLSYFVLANLLLPNLKAASAARIVSTSSRAHQGMRLDFDDLQGRKRYCAYIAYGRSKLCNILFTREMARRLEGTGITANCFHPGFVDTAFAESSEGALRALFRLGKRLVAISPQDGARTLVCLAASASVAGKSGGYYARGRLAWTTPAARRDGDAQKLWDVSARIAGL
jgi:NAD(P)-dependent dehydrogenase (short-subunit alcohol dehydrogenase family)